MGFLIWLRSFGKRERAERYQKNGLRLCRQKEWSRAISEFSKALGLSSSLEEARFGRANAYFMLGDWDEAIADFSKLLQNDPHSTKALLGRASSYLSKAGEIAERFRKAGGKHHDLTFEEMTMPMNKLLKSVPPEKAMFIRTTNMLMELEFIAKKDLEHTLKLEPGNKLAQSLLNDLNRFK
ncbi:MAG: tetratricopeptide repeat protein [Deltaproteobacteria bacterium]|nr:tetratricopeptide repeat protein [Deltaproteobacteria bacterium]